MLKCDLCNGHLVDRLITFTRLKDGNPLIIENVPAKVCEECKGEIFTPPVLDAIEKIISANNPKKCLTVPVFDMEGTDIGDRRLNSPEFHPAVKCLFNSSVDLRTIKRMLKGKSEVKVWIEGGNNINHPDDNILQQLSEAFSSLPQQPVKNLVDITENGYILYELRDDICNEKGDPIRLPVAKMVYINNENRWHLFWIWRSGIWQEYGFYSDLNQVVEQIKEDKLRFCA